LSGEESIVLLDGFFTSLRSVQNDNTHVYAIISLQERSDEAITSSLKNIINTRKE